MNPWNLRHSWSKFLNYILYLARKRYTYYLPRNTGKWKDTLFCRSLLDLRHDPTLKTSCYRSPKVNTLRNACKWYHPSFLLVLLSDLAAQRGRFLDWNRGPQFLSPVYNPNIRTWLKLTNNSPFFGKFFDTIKKCQNPMSVIIFAYTGCVPAVREENTRLVARSLHQTPDACPAY